ncbi:hypothetical protein [Aeromonas salmonicida]|nr:hypothetical protein [Aeromonas salmonicida]
MIRSLDALKVPDLVNNAAKPRRGRRPRVLHGEGMPKEASNPSP